MSGGHKTYWHLRAERRIPSAYELLSSRLSYHPALGSAVQTPALAFHRQYPMCFTVRDWDAFHDPAETTYATYVASRRDRELFVQQLLQGIDGSDYDARLDRRWLSLLERVLAPLRYPAHGLHMLAAYLAQAAPSSRIAIALAFQCGDEIRRVSWLAYRTQQLALVHPDFGELAKHDWQHNPALQPLREMIERLLVTYEWGEAFVALNLVFKPLFDEFFGRRLSALARSQGDDVLGRLLLSLCEDQRWHAACAFALGRQIVGDGNAARVEELIERWRPRAFDALGAASTLTDSVSCPPDLAGELERVHAFARVQCGLPAQRSEALPDAADTDGRTNRQLGGAS